MTVADQVAEWYAAGDSDAQWRAVDQLVGIANGTTPSEDWTERSRATSALIGLLHLARHPVDQVALIRSLGQCSQFVAVPALHAETHAAEPSVRAAALDALGRLGLPFGGALAAGWLAERDPEEESGPVLESALLALARTGHPRVGEEASRLWETGRIRASVLHAALADAVSPQFLSLARQHVAEPAIALSAAVHLATLRVPDLGEALGPLLRSEELTHVQLAERLLALPQPGPEDHLLEIMEQRTRDVAALGRRARGLRVHAAPTLAEAYATLTEGINVTSGDGRHWIRVALLSGIPALQSAALSLAAREERTLVQALSFLCHDSPGLQEFLDTWERDGEDRVQAAAMRARVNVFGAASLSSLSRYATHPAVTPRLEYVRALQNALRNQRDAGGRTGLAHAERTSVAANLRTALRAPEEAIRERAAFATGNIGLTEMADLLRGLLSLDQPWKVRRAAATALSELPPANDLGPIAVAAREEPNSEVLFRLVRVLLRGIRGGKAVTEDVLAVARDGMQRDDPSVAVLSMVLRGAAGDRTGTEALVREAEGTIQARAAAAITALGELGDPKATSALTALVRHADEARRRRAAEALGAVGGTAAALALVKMVERETHPAVRAAAVRALSHCPAPQAEVHRLQPDGADDPLMFEILQARMASLAGRTPLSAKEIDARLAAAIPGFSPGRMQKRVPAALRALRTAAYLDDTTALPAGLDAAPPVLFWTKGLELWLNDALAPLLLALRREIRAIDGAVPLWNRWKKDAGVWREPSGNDLWANLLQQLVEGLRIRNRQTLSLRVLAAALLASGPLAARLRIRRWPGRLSDGERVRLANRLTELAWRRNPLTHRRAGTVEEAREARKLALEAASLAARA